MCHHRADPNSEHGVVLEYEVEPACQIDRIPKARRTAGRPMIEGRVYVGLEHRRNSSKSVLAVVNPVAASKKIARCGRRITNEYISDGLLENGRNRIIAAKCQKTNMLSTLLSG
jgi:hypothetical protein